MQVETHVLGPTLMPRFLMPRFYRVLTDRLAGDGPVHYHAMPERGGLGRTDLVVDHFRPLLEAAAAKRHKVRLAGHSLGGLVAWVLAHDYPYAIDVAELWCTPVRGTALANVTVPVAESRFLARASRWIRRYDRPVEHTRVRAIYTTLDQLAVPSRYACYLEGDNVSNVVVSPNGLKRREQRPNEHVHRGAAEHVTLPRLASVNRWLAATW